jgi:hypothetical protein
MIHSRLIEARGIGEEMGGMAGESVGKDNAKGIAATDCRDYKKGTPQLCLPKREVGIHPMAKRHPPA